MSASRSLLSDDISRARSLLIGSITAAADALDKAERHTRTDLAKSDPDATARYALQSLQSGLDAVHSLSRGSG